MINDDLENRDSLSANVILGVASSEEIKIFNQLVDEWNKEFGRDSSDINYTIDKAAHEISPLFKFTTNN